MIGDVWLEKINVNIGGLERNLEKRRKLESMEAENSPDTIPK
ncbi:MAG: hypothetical protein AAE987_06340 [Thermoplasmataceae archaeon]|jgi:hypothetical protein